MSFNANIFSEEPEIEAAYQRVYNSDYQEFLELTCRVTLLKTAEKQRWRLTKTDARNLALTFLDTRHQSKERAAKGRALIRKIYEDKIAKVAERNQREKDLLEEDTRKVNEQFHKPDSPFTGKIKFWTKMTLMDADQYIQVVNFTFQGKKKNDKGIMLALIMLDIDISEESLTGKKEEIPDLKKEEDSLMAAYRQHMALSKGPDKILERLEQVDEKLTALDLWKKYSTQLIALLAISFIGFFVYNYLSQPSQSDFPDNTSLPLILSEGVPLLEEDNGTGIRVADESLNQQSQGPYQVSLKFTNYSAEKVYYLDALLFTIQGRATKTVTSKSALANKAHLFMEKESRNYSLRFLASDQSGSDIPVRHSKFMEVLVSGEKGLEDRTLTFILSAVVHDQFGNSDTISVAKPYSVIF